MNIELNFSDLRLLAVHSEVVKDGITITINRPILPSLNCLHIDKTENRKDEYVAFTLDSGDPRSKQWTFTAQSQS